MKITQHEPMMCPGCSHGVNACTSFETDASPEPGDFTVCIRCASVLTFTEEPGLAIVPQDELDALNPDTRDTLMRAVHMVELVNQEEARQ